jgi:predicted ribosomally synthesized peptide with SipW-like signal peptide
MKKIIGLTIAALLIIGLVAGGTLAYFSDTEASNGNTFTAGTLNLVSTVDGTGAAGKFIITAGGDGLNGNVAFSNIAPGETGTITWTLSNTGSISGNLTMLAATTFGEGAAPNDAELAADSTNLVGLDQKLTVWVTRGGTDIPGLGTTLAYVPMSDLAAGLNLENQTIAASGSLVYVLNWQVPTIVGNEIQGDNATLDITFTLTQN